MKVRSFWVEIVMAGTAVACALALLLATLGGIAGVASDAFGSAATASVEQTYEGMVSCSRCGARHSAQIGKTATDCTLACVRGDAQFALVDGDKTYVLDGDLVVLKGVAGRRARVAGFLTGNKIRVSSVKAE